MASSSKRRASSSKQSSAGKARVVSVRRTDALPRKVNGSAGRRKPVVEPPIGAPMESLATTVAGSNKEAHSLKQTETTASRTKTTRAAGRASGKRKKPVKALEPIAETFAAVAPEVEASAIGELEVEESAILEETTIVEASFALPVEAVTFPSTAIGQLAVSEETRGLPLARSAAQRPAPAAPAPHDARRALVTVVSRLVSALCRWTGVRL